ncbi:MAG: nucleoside recognition domain-containing protein [Bacteroidales bacterium]
MTRKILTLAKSIQPNTNIFANRLFACIKEATPRALKTAIWILKITIPVSFVVSMLNYFGVIQLLTRYLSPAFNLIGLRGEASLAFVTGILLNIYSAIATISQLTLNLREITILAVMSLIAHNLMVETAIQSKTGSKAWHMVALRVGAAFGAAALLNLILPDFSQKIPFAANSHSILNFSDALINWVYSSFRLILNIVLLVSMLMILQKILQEFNLIQLLSKPLNPLLKLMGLPPSTSFLWIVANSLGLAYGSAVMLEEVRQNRVSRRDADLLNYHIAISHSNLEDLLLFAALGVPILWMLIPRVIIAIAAVWGRRFFVNR